jgi:hypothetical protein
MPDVSEQARHVRSVLSGGNADHALELALSAALEAGRAVLSDYRHRPPAEKFAMAIQSAGEELDRIGLAVVQPPEAEG